MTLSELAEVTGGRLGDPADATIVVTGAASVDSRAVPAGGLFVAVPGERVDGHDYAAAAVRGGAAAVLCSREVDAPSVLVADPVAALASVARHLVDASPRTAVLAVTGSQGKTGTKDYLSHVLAGAGEVVATRGNHNNELGVPLTVSGLETGTDFLVVEMGARGVGHVAELCRTAPPRVAAVLNVGTAHVGEFGSQEMIARAKGEIVEALGPDGTAVLNADDPHTAVMGARTVARVLSFGRTESADVRALGVTSDELGRPTFTLTHGGQEARVRLAQLGAHQVENALAAAAMARAVGVPLALVAERLSSTTEVSRWRMEPHVRSDGLLVVNDAYNANPDSVRSALETVGHIGRGRSGRSVAVLGEMLELGESAEEAHRAAGADAAAAGVDVLVTVGRAAALAAQGALAHGGWAGEAIVTASRDEALGWVRENVTSADVVLVKASRGAALEKIVDELLLEGNATR